MTTTRFRLLAATLLLVLCAGALAACSNGDDAGETSSDDAAIAPETSIAEQADGDAAAGEAEAADAAAPDLDLDAAAATAQRDVISTAELTVEVDDLDEAGDAAAEIAAGAGGYVAGEDTDRGDRASSRLTLKVEPEQFEAVLDELAALGDLRTQEITTDDVTEAVVDLESRIATAEASVDRLRALTEEAGSVPDLVALESELLERETTLEQLRGELRTLEDLVAFATVEVTLTTEDGGPVVEEDDDRDLPTYLGGLEAGWDVLVAIVAAALAVLGFFTPFLPPVLLVAGIVLFVFRRKARRASAEHDEPASDDEPVSQD